MAKNLSIITFLLTVFFSCGTDPEPSGCIEPSSPPCSDNCTYYRVYDADGNYITEGVATSAGGVYWNGTDCHGVKVPCGKYRVRVTVIQYGSSMSQSNYVIMTDDSTQTAQGAASCDSLAENCSGNYVETTIMVIDNEGIIRQDVGCACCL